MSRLLLLRNARAIRGVPEELAKATCMLVNRSTGRIVAVGDDASCLRQVDDKNDFYLTTVDLCGSKTIVPGFYDAHGHIWLHGLNLTNMCDLTGVKSNADMVRKLDAYAAEKPMSETATSSMDEQWLLGFGWDDTKFDAGGVGPDRFVLDKHFPTRPVWLRRVDVHVAVANTQALLQCFGERFDEVLTVASEQLGNKGEIRRNAAGLLSGIFVDGGQDLVFAKIPPPSDAALQRALGAVAFECAQRGITSVSDAASSWHEVKVLEDAMRAGKLPSLRIHVMVNSLSRESFEHIVARGPFCVHDDDNGHANGGSVRLRVCSVKFFSDGALGSHGAAMLAPYLDSADGNDRGLMLLDANQFAADVRRCHEAGLQCCTHAIGDRANSFVLETYADALAGRGCSLDHRWRVEHAQLLPPSHLGTMGDLGVIASVQPLHCTNDCRWIGHVVHEESLPGAYAWKSLSRVGRICLGSDFPVETMDVIQGMYAACTRDAVANLARRPVHQRPSRLETALPSLPMPSGVKSSGRWHEEEALSRSEALRGFTIDAAYASFDESERGELRPGACADFVLLDADPLDETLPLEDFLGTRILATFVNSICVFIDGDFAQNEIVRSSGWEAEMVKTWETSL